MTKRIYHEENNVYQFDFSAAVWATDQLHNIYNSKANLLSDVDFIAETEDNIILLEYKNASIPGASNPEKFVPSDSKYVNKIAYKFYDSWIYLKAINKNKPILYVYILEYPNGDFDTRLHIRNLIGAVLPIELQKLPEISCNCKIIEEFYVMSIKEWNSHETFGKFPIEKIPAKDESHAGEFHMV